MDLYSLCPTGREISPCTCTPGMYNTIQVTCEGMDSFHDVIEALNGRFNPDLNINLTISFSKLLVSVDDAFSVRRRVGVYSAHCTQLLITNTRSLPAGHGESNVF